MGLIATLTNVLGAVLLVHSVYSAWEHSLILPTTAKGSAESLSSPKRSNDLPLDITLETLVSVVLLSVGLVFSSPDLKPIRWRTWAGQTEREKSGEPQSLDDPVISKPFLGLDERAGFLDIRAKRKEYADWKASARKG